MSATKLRLLSLQNELAGLMLSLPQFDQQFIREALDLDGSGPMRALGATLDP